MEDSDFVLIDSINTEPFWKYKIIISEQDKKLIQLKGLLKYCNKIIEKKNVAIFRLENIIKGFNQ